MEAKSEHLAKRLRKLTIEDEEEKQQKRIAIRAFNSLCSVIESCFFVFPCEQIEKTNNDVAMLDRRSNVVISSGLFGCCRKEP